MSDPEHSSLDDAVEAHFAKMGMPTYAQAVEQIQHLVENSPGEFSVLIGDADGLKDTNDGSGGHLAGDKIIIEAGEALAAHTTASGFVSLGRRSEKAPKRRKDADKHRNPSTNHRKGDEFIVVLPGVTDQLEIDALVEDVQTTLATQGIRMTLSGRPHSPGESARQILRGVDALLNFDKGDRSVADKTREQLEVAVLIGELVAKNNLSLRELPKILRHLPFMPYELGAKTNPASSDAAQTAPKDPVDPS